MKRLTVSIMVLSVVLSGATCTELNQEVNMLRYSDLPNTTGDSDDWTAQALDDSSATDEDGTGLSAGMVNDEWGFAQAAMKSVGKIPSGDVETADDSEILSALLNNMGKNTNLLFNSHFIRNSDGRNESGGTGVFRVADGWILDTGSTSINISFAGRSVDGKGWVIQGSGASGEAFTLTQEAASIGDFYQVPDPGVTLTQEFTNVLKVGVVDSGQVPVKVYANNGSDWSDYFTIKANLGYQTVTLDSSNFNTIQTAYKRTYIGNDTTPTIVNTDPSGMQAVFELQSAGTFSIRIYGAGLFRGSFDPTYVTSDMLPNDSVRDRLYGELRYSAVGPHYFKLTTPAWDTAGIPGEDLQAIFTVNFPQKIFAQDTYDISRFNVTIDTATVYSGRAARTCTPSEVTRLAVTDDFMVVRVNLTVDTPVASSDSDQFAYAAVIDGIVTYYGSY